MSRDRPWPEHLRRLERGLRGKAKARVEDFLAGGTEEISTSRLGRAGRLGRAALGSSGRLLAVRAKRALGRDDPEDATALGMELLESLGEMRGLAMKLGQMLSYLEGVLPPEAQNILSLLQRDAPAVPWSAMRAVFETDLGEAPESRFAEIEETPIAAASIGQVHRARLRDGTLVAVKIQYPGIAEAMQIDLSNARILGLFQRVFFFRTNTKAIFAELEARFLEECDYRREAEHQLRFRRRFDGHPTILIPEVHLEHSSRRVLTTTFHQGLGFYEWLDTNPGEDARRRTATTLYRFYLGSLYLDGIFNCDPHPGNYIFEPDGKIVFLDHGSVRAFEPERRLAWIRMCRAVCDDEPTELHQAAADVGFIPPGVDYDREALRALLRYLYQAHLEDHEFDFSRMAPMDTFRQMFSENPNLFRMDMPADAVFLNRITFGLVSILAGVGVTLNCHRLVKAYFDGRDPDWPASNVPVSEAPRPPA